MIVPPSLQATGIKVSGTVSSRTASEWYRVATKGFGNPSNSSSPGVQRTSDVLPCISRAARSTTAPCTAPRT